MISYKGLTAYKPISKAILILTGISQSLLDQPNFKQLHFRSLRISQAGGTAIVVTDRKFNGTIGIPAPSLEVIVVNDDGERVGLY